MPTTQSDVVTGVSVSFDGSFIHRPDSPDATIFWLPYGGVGRKESRSRESTAMKFAGRTYPVMDFGSGQEYALSLSTTLEYGADWEFRLARLREMSTSALPWLYRDKRGRKMYVSPSDFEVTDIPYGYEVAMGIRHVDFTEAV